MSADPGIKLGVISGVYGIKGWIKVYSYTNPRDNILRFPSWLLGSDAELKRFSVEEGLWHGKTAVAKLAGIETRDEATRLVGRGIFIERAALPELPESEYYWADLVGLDVFTEAGVSLGLVEDLIETGANDVLVVQGDRERLIPFVQKEIVKSVDLDRRRMVVAWDPDF
ncbi:MAG: ribosome maturation factor RimM [Methylococcaceae bacterium]|nr:ribosome maturation factor RimM [Methylococcaceae bacterium]